jgi:hypothetical protein
MEINANYIKTIVERLADNHGLHFSIGKLLAIAIAKWAILNPLPQGTEFTANIMSIVSSFESGNRVNVKGDSGKSYCAFQVQQCAPWKCEDLLTDADKCAEVGLLILHRSFDACPANPLAPYASGYCKNDAGIRISKHRVELAEDLLLPAGLGYLFIAAF